MQLNDLAWRVVVLPCVDTLPLAAWKNLYAFWKSGGTVIAVGALPVNSDMEFPCNEVQEMAKAMFSNEANVGGGHGVYVDNGQEALLPRMVDAVVPPHVRIPKGATLRTTHRRIDGREVFFVINDSTEPWSGEISISAKGNATQWNPATWNSLRHPDNPQEIPLKLEPYGGMLFRFDEFIPESNDALPISILPDAMPVSKESPEMHIGKGEFVEAHVEKNSEITKWTADATLTKSDVDTFLFLCFTYSDIC